MQGCFDETAAALRRPNFEDKYGSPTNESIFYISSKGEHTVYPIVKNNVIENLLIVKDLNDGYFISRTNSLSSSEIADTYISAGITKLFSIEPIELSSVDYTQEIALRLGDNFSVFVSNGSLIIEELFEFETDVNSVSTSNVSSLCASKNTANQIVEIFNLEIDQATVNAIQDLFGGPNIEYVQCFCLSNCQIRNIIDEANTISQTVKDQLNQNFLIMELGLAANYPISSHTSEELSTLSQIECGNIILDEDEIINDGFVFDCENIDRICANLFTLTPPDPNPYNPNQAISWFAGLNGLNLSFKPPSGSSNQENLNIEMNYLQYWMEADCINPSLNYAEVFANATKEAYEILQTNINSAQPELTEDEIRRNFVLLLDNILDGFFRECANTNPDDAEFSTDVILGTHNDRLTGPTINPVIYTRINELEIDTSCPE